MENIPAIIQSKSPVRVVPFDGGWTVQWDSGYYACPVSKEAAIIKASRIAVETGRPQIAIMTAEGLVERFVPPRKERP